jgi:hypothetical protein
MSSGIRAPEMSSGFFFISSGIRAPEMSSGPPFFISSGRGFSEMSSGFLFISSGIRAPEMSEPDILYERANKKSGKSSVPLLTGI